MIFRPDGFFLPGLSESLGFPTFPPWAFLGFRENDGFPEPPGFFNKEGFAVPTCSVRVEIDSSTKFWSKEGGSGSFSVTVSSADTSGEGGVGAKGGNSREGAGAGGGANGADS